MKVGDRVKVTKLRDEDSGFYNLVGELGTIVDSVGPKNDPKHHVRFYNHSMGVWSLFPDELELIKE